MKKTMNLKSAAKYSEMFCEVNCLDASHPALKKMQALSDSLPGGKPTAIAKLEVYKECHRLADDLYHLTGSKKVFVNVLRIGNLLISRLFNPQEQTLQVNQ